MSFRETYPKRLIEVDLPIKRISAHARREKSTRHGHISTLHIWWARRPLAACRAVICAALWPNPADSKCPQAFIKKAREQMLAWTPHDRQKLLSDESRKRFEKARQRPALFDDAEELRGALLDFIADFANWDNSTVRTYLDTSRALTQAAHEALGGTAGTRPLVVEPFAGGGSIPLEALRVGANIHASDLNPIPVLLNRALVEWIPRYGAALAAELRAAARLIRKKALSDLARLYPVDEDGGVPVAYLWARVARCEGPRCGAEIPLVRSPVVAKRGKDSVRFRIGSNPHDRIVDVELVTGPESHAADSGTVRRGAAVCPICGYTTPAVNVRAQFAKRRGGAADARLLAVAILKQGIKSYRLPAERDRRALDLARQELPGLAGVVCPAAVPLPYLRSIFNIKLLGVETWSDLFTPRQLVHLGIFAKHVREASAPDQVANAARRTALGTLLGFAVDKMTDFHTSLCTWISVGEKIGHTFGRQALGIVWDFAEANPFANISGSWDRCVEYIAEIIEENAIIEAPGHAQAASATALPLPSDSAALMFTDPPYYDLVPYADLSDFFYVWLRRTVGYLHPDLFRETLSPKNEEIVQLAERNQAYSYKTRENYERLMGQAMAEGRRVVEPNGIGVVVFAHKGTEAWESQLQAMIDAGWIIVASWSIDTEREGRLRAMKSASLSSSVHLVCRPRENAATTDAVGDWRDVLAELPKRIHDWMPRLAEEGVVGADAIFACLGPALEVFSRYSRVEKASGNPVSLKEYLEQVWAAVAKEALAMIFTGADATGFEADARLTAMWLWTLSTSGSNGKGNESGEMEDDEPEAAEDGTAIKDQAGGFVLEYDAARKIAQGLGAHLEQLTSLIEVKGATARLLPVAERTRSLFQKGGTAALRPAAKQRGKASSSLWDSCPISRKRRRAEDGAKPEYPRRERPSSTAFTSR